MREWHWNGSWSERTGERKRGQRKVYELFRYVYYTSNYISQSTHICSKFRRAQDQTWDPNLLPDPHGDYLQHPQGLPHPTRLSWHQQKSHSAMEKFNCQNQSSSFMQSLTVGNCKWMRNHATKWVCLHDVSCIKINLFLRSISLVLAACEWLTIVESMLSLTRPLSLSSSHPKWTKVAHLPLQPQNDLHLMISISWHARKSCLWNPIRLGAIAISME